MYEKFMVYVKMSCGGVGAFPIAAVCEESARIQGGVYGEVLEIENVTNKYRISFWELRDAMRRVICFEQAEFIARLAKEFGLCE